MAAKVSTEVKKLVFADPNMTPVAILAILEQNGVKASLTSVEVYRSDFLNSVMVLRELGAFANALVVPQEPLKKPRKMTPPSRPMLWAAACSRALAGLEEAQAGIEDLKSIQEEYEEMKDSLTEGLTQTPFGQKLEEICDLDLEIDLEDAINSVSEAEGAELPLGFGRD